MVKQQQPECVCEHTLCPLPRHILDTPLIIAPQNYKQLEAESQIERFDPGRT